MSRKRIGRTAGRLAPGLALALAGLALVAGAPSRHLPPSAQARSAGVAASSTPEWHFAVARAETDTLDLQLD